MEEAAAARSARSTDDRARLSVVRDGERALALSWPLAEQARHFELGHVLNSAATHVVMPTAVGALGAHHAGVWECDLSNDSLIWSGGVYDMFGLERVTCITRAQALAHYTEDSRARLERLRAHAIRHELGFTIDVEIRAAAVGHVRHVRLIGAPVFEGCTAVRLHGVKLLL